MTWQGPMSGTWRKNDVKTLNSFDFSAFGELYEEKGTLCAATQALRSLIVLPCLRSISGTMSQWQL